ncbi:MAG: hypothetical protein ACK2U9_07005 [Anaerolineae bacterium]
MRYSRWLLGLGVLVMALATGLLGSPPATASGLHAPLFQEAVITSPEAFANVRGNVSIFGTATHPQFQRYELYYTIEPGDNWVFIGEAHFEQVANGLLGTWDTGSLPDGTYSLRLRVVRQDGNYDEAYQRSIVVANAAPPPTPTPTETVAPEERPTLPPVAQPTAASAEETPTPILVEQPEIPTPTPRPSPSPTPTPDPAASIVDQVDDDSGFFSSTPDTTSLRQAAATGMAYVGGAFLAVGVFFGIKKLFTWLWYLIAP